MKKIITENKKFHIVNVLRWRLKCKTCLIVKNIWVSLR